MLKVTTPVVVLLAPFAGCFNEPVHATFCVMVVAWIACLGRRTISRVWQTTGQAGDTDHSRAYRLFNQAAPKANRGSPTQQEVRSCSRLPRPWSSYSPHLPAV